MSFEAIAVMDGKITVFWDMTPCSLTFQRNVLVPFSGVKESSSYTPKWW
jgi:hypothetical protein